MVIHSFPPLEPHLSPRAQDGSSMRLILESQAACLRAVSLIISSGWELPLIASTERQMRNRLSVWEGGILSKIEDGMGKVN